MKFEGKVYRNGKFWLAEIPGLDLLTQGRTKKEAFRMAKDIVLAAVDCEDFALDLMVGSGDTFIVSSADSKKMIALMLRRLRQKHGLSLRDVAQRLNSTSPNTFGAYEQGKSTPTLPQLEKLIQAIDPKSEIVLRISKVA